MIDLHVHSYWSDGDQSPAQLVRMAKAKGLEAIALTDHDTLAGGAELRQAGLAEGLRVLEGIEISCTQEDGRQLHLLGHNFSETGRDVMEAFCAPIRQSRNEAVRQAVAAVRALGYPVTLEQVQAMAGPGGDLCKQYVMQVLIDAGVCDELYGSLYRKLFKEGPARLSFYTPRPEEALRWVAAAGGRAVLAHPGQYNNFAMVPVLARAGLWGIEAYHPKHSEADTAHCLSLAAEYGLAVTGGSDFHGRFGEGEVLGDHGVERVDL